MLRELNGKIAVLDLADQESMTFYHYVEEMHKVPYRYFKDFTGDYTGYDGLIKKKKYTIFVRNLDEGIVTNVNPMGELLWKEKLYQGYRVNTKSGLRTIDANKLFDFVSSKIQLGQANGLLYILKK